MESEVPKEAPSLPVPVEAPPVGPQPEPQPQPRPEKKPFRLNKWHVATVILVVIIAVQAFMYVSLTMSFNSLNSEHEKLVSEHETLEASHSSLESSYSSLQSSHSSLQWDYNRLQSNYNALHSNYESLQSSYDSLQSSFDSYNSDYASLSSSVNQRALQLDVMGFVTPNDPAVKNMVQSVTGGWSNPSDWNEYWSDMKKMYDWVVDNVKYRYDGLSPILPSTPSGSVQYAAEMWQFANETLSLRKGDCEDMAILLASMILSYNGGKYWVECILVVGSSGGHAAVQVPVSGDKVTILDPAGNYYTRGSGGSLVSKDVSTEINNWLDYWKPQMGSDVRVERVFSKTLDESFSSTSEYVTWMYNR